MKASQLIEALKAEIDLHGDCEVYYEFDSGIRVYCDTLTFVENIPVSSFDISDDVIEKGIVINMDTDW